MDILGFYAYASGRRSCCCLGLSLPGYLANVAAISVGFDTNSEMRRGEITGTGSSQAGIGVHLLLFYRGLVRLLEPPVQT